MEIASSQLNRFLESLAKSLYSIRPYCDQQTFYDQPKISHLLSCMNCGFNYSRSTATSDEVVCNFACVGLVKRKSLTTTEPVRSANVLSTGIHFKRFLHLNLISLRLNDCCWRLQNDVFKCAYVNLFVLITNLMGAMLCWYETCLNLYMPSHMSLEYSAAFEM